MPIANPATRVTTKSRGQGLRSGAEIAAGEVEKIVHVLPKELKDLWPAQAGSSRAQAV